MNDLVRRWRFAINERWFTYLGMAVIFAVACGLLSNWQFGRNAQVVAANTLLNQNYNARAVTPETLLPTRSSYSPKIEWRTVKMTGRYLTAKQLLVRDRSLGSNPGYEVLTPFRLTNGSIFVIDRGWVPIGTKTVYPSYIPPAPTGVEQVTARLQESESVLPGRVSPSGEISEINLPTVAKMTKLTGAYTGAYGLLATESPKPAERPVAASKPVLDSGPYLSYACQWILFALIGFGALARALRNEYRIRNADDPTVRAHAAERARKASLRTPTDADIEDAQIAQEQRREVAAADVTPG
jgi:cytochrome oxidase assembly protein ShyY1